MRHFVKRSTIQIRFTSNTDDQSLSAEPFAFEDVLRENKTDVRSRLQLLCVFFALFLLPALIIIGALIFASHRGRNTPFSMKLSFTPLHSPIAPLNEFSSSYLGSPVLSDIQSQDLVAPAEQQLHAPLKDEPPEATSLVAPAQSPLLQLKSTAGLESDSKLFGVIS